MTEKKPVFRTVDEFIFKQVDALKSSQPYQDLIRQMSVLNDFQLKTVNQVISLLFVILPILLFIVLWFINISFNNNLDKKREILTEINKFSSSQKKLQSLGKNIISGAAITTKGSFGKKISNSMSTAGGERSNVKVLHFESVPKDGIVNATGVTSFNKVSTKVLSSFLSDLAGRSKFRISALMVKKNIKDNVVSGQIQLQHYGRAPKGK
jgi:translation initiation factor 2B subunit (eIF-2B alpha/beta/delta family)